MSVELTQDELLSIAEAAACAPAADNRRNFGLRYNQATVEIWPKASLESASKGQQLLAAMSLGAATHNMCLQADRLGLHLEILAENDLRFGAFPFVRLSPSRSEASSDPLVGMLRKRQSNRRLLFRGPGLTAEEQSHFTDSAEHGGSAHLCWLDLKHRRRKAVDLIRRAESERFRERQLHAELFGSIRFDAGWHRNCTEGLPPAALDLPPLERHLFSALKHWPVQRAANLLGTHWFVGWRGAGLPCVLAPHVAAVTAQGPALQAAFSAGRCLQRAWLLAAARGWAFQVLAASPLYALPGAFPASASLRSRLATGWTELCPDHTPYVVFRMGKAAPSSLHAAKASAKELLQGLPTG